MTDLDHASVTRLLEAAREGTPGALNALFPLVYDELHALAHRKRGWATAQAWLHRAMQA